MDLKERIKSHSKFYVSYPFILMEVFNIKFNQKIPSDYWISGLLRHGHQLLTFQDHLIDKFINDQNLVREFLYFERLDKLDKLDI